MRQVRNLAHALVDTFAPLGDCPARGAKIAVTRTDDGVRIQLTAPADGHLIVSALVPWVAEQKPRLAAAGHHKK
jgi:hypothetical protein